ncbi:MAG: putative inorganic carbon (HCO3(-)) transporter [Flavobacteriales bacterium]|jgi:putative inorganic carbon (HCO3(-)) transporter
MQRFLQHKWAWISMLLFLLLNSVLIVNEFYWLSLLPFVLLIGTLFFLALDKLLLAMVFFTPLSINITEYIDSPIGMFLPTEPVLFAVLLLFIVRFVFLESLSKEILRHPITWVIIAQLSWMAFTTVTSFDVLVSFKYLLARLWFVVSFYFLGIRLFQEKKRLIQFVWAYVFGMILVIGYTLANHAGYNFAHGPAHWVMSPFFNDHTSYGALLVFFFPLLVGFLFFKGKKVQYKWGVSLIIVLFTIATVLSYTRAAWLGLIGAGMVWACIYFKIRFRVLLMAGVALLIAFFSLKDQVMMRMEKNSQDSSDDFAEHIQSMTNVSTDASNLERLNRWHAAFGLFAARPVLGWGPGTYQFVYAPFQDPNKKTVISTNGADKGNAHSEYIGPLAEQGVLGGLLMLVLIAVVLTKGIKLYYKVEDREVAIILLCMILGLITYYVHGVLNNFLDTDKASVPFWGFTAAIVAIDLYYKKKPTEIEEGKS